MQELIEHIKNQFETIGYKISIEADSFLQKEKEQIIDAVDYGCSDWGSSKDAEKYYNQTYNQNK